jgi:Cu2+-exporting ATPase
MKHENHNMHKEMSMQGMKHETPVHTMHIKTFKMRFFVCLAFTIPVLLLSEAIQTWFHYTLTLPYQTYILLFLAVIIYGYGG